jgi:hypothetical protein
MKWELKINNILIIPQTMNEDFLVRVNPALSSLVLRTRAPRGWKGRADDEKSRGCHLQTNSHLSCVDRATNLQ